MRVDAENIISLSEKDSTHELQEYLSSVTPEQVSAHTLITPITSCLLYVRALIWSAG